MKTFLGFATGLLTGVLAGIGYTACVLLTDKDVRDYVDKKANEIEE